jgi:cytochrome c biogenesis protein CcmG/thiol:disulfide interchange protein DsbE
MTDVAPPVSPPPSPTPRRRVNNGVLWASGLAVVVLAIATIVAFTAGSGDDGVQQIDPDNPSQLQGRDVTGESASDVTFTRFDGGVEGAQGTVGDYAGRPLVINFFASWCVPCVAEMPEFEQVHQQFGDRVAFLGMNETEQVESARRIIDQTGVTYDLGRDPDGAVLRAFGGAVMPTTVFVDADGTIVKVHSGKLSQAELEQIIRDDLHA